MLVALASGPEDQTQVIRRFAPLQETAVFLRFAIGAWMRMPYISPAGMFGHKNS
jgi:hypothetical protein